MKRHNLSFWWAHWSSCLGIPYLSTGLPHKAPQKRICVQKNPQTISPLFFCSMNVVFFQLILLSFSFTFLSYSHGRKTNQESQGLICQTFTNAFLPTLKKTKLNHSQTDPRKTQIHLETVWRQFLECVSMKGCVVSQLYSPVNCSYFIL